MKTSSDDKILLVNTQYGLSTESYKSLLEMVCGVLENGGLGGGIFGSIEHVNALKKVDAKIRKVCVLIAEHNSDQKKPAAPVVASCEAVALAEALAEEKNLHAQTRAVVEELNEICAHLRKQANAAKEKTEIFPEVVATLRAMTEIAERWGPGEHFDGEYSTARAVIKKAEGQQ